MLMKDNITLNTPKARCKLRVFSLLVASLFFIGWPGFAIARERTATEDRVIRLTLPIDNQQVTGTITRYDTLTFTLETEHADTHRVLWNAIPAVNVDRFWRHLEQPEEDAQALYELGDLLIRHREGKQLAEAAFEQALAIDPALAEAVQRSRDGRNPDNSPRYVGVADPQMWGELSDEQMQKGAKSRRAFAEKAQGELEIQLSLFESDRFMLLTDLQAEQAQTLTAKLTQAYRTTAQLLGDNPDTNIFRGKCLVVIFSKRVDYLRFQQQLHDTDARGTGGLCHGFGDGHVHIAAFTRPNERQTHHILAHEVVHAYLHRYRTPVPIEDWLNEGLAEYIARQIEPPPGKQNVYLNARLALEGKKGLGEGFYEGENLEQWQYEVAGALTQYLLKRGEHAYPKLIQQIKEGKPSAEALEDVYRMQPRVLTQRFKRQLDRALNEKLGL